MQRFPAAVPLSMTECGLPGALSVKFSRAFLATGILLQDGVNVTCMVQNPAGAMLAEQLSVSLKSPAFAPDSEILLISNFPGPESVAVTATG